jgi:copper chaperone CopZ
MATTILTAPGIKCQGCAQTVSQALARSPGIQEVRVDPTTKKVTVEFEPGLTSVEHIRTALRAAGFPPA